MEVADVIKIMKKYTIVDQKPIVFDIKNSNGCYLHDRLSNSDYLDFLGFSAVNPIGFNHPAMHEKQFLEKLSNASLVKPNPVKFPTIEHAEWIETFVRVCGRDYFKHYLS